MGGPVEQVDWNRCRTTPGVDHVGDAAAGTEGVIWAPEGLGAKEIAADPPAGGIGQLGGAQAKRAWLPASVALTPHLGTSGSSVCGLGRHRLPMCSGGVVLGIEKRPGLALELVRATLDIVLIAQANQGADLTWMALARRIATYGSSLGICLGPALQWDQWGGDGVWLED